MLRLANIADWQVPKTKDNRQLRDAAYAVPPQALDSELSSDSDSKMDIPLAKLAKKYRHERQTPEDEDDIPLMELAKRMICQKESVSPHLSNDDSQIENMDYNDDMPSDKNSYHSASDSDNTMCVN